MGFKIAPYLIFDNDAADALEFYRDVLGGELTLTRFSEFPNPDRAKSDDDKVMHGELELDNGFVIHAADTATDDPGDDSASATVSLFGDDVEELRGYFESLSNGGTVLQPYELAPWGDYFGALQDAFGVQWFVNSAN